nr:hypothetical protein [uncultured Cellulosilyticum sp.]
MPQNTSKNREEDEINEYFSIPIPILRTIICISLALSLFISVILFFIGKFSLENMRDIATTSIGFAFTIIVFVLSITFLGNKLENDTRYRNNTKIFVFNIFLTVAISLLTYSFSFLDILPQVMRNLFSCVTLSTLVYSTTRSLVFMIANFKIDTLEQNK